MTPPIRGITVCVDYDDLLEITLWRNARHLTEIVVVTHPDDVRTKEVVSRVPCARAFETDAFYRNGAKFNKGLAMEEGLDFLGREGWIVIWDADTLFPDEMRLPPLRCGILYSPERVILNDPRHWTPDFDWRMAKATSHEVFAGYFQLFSADDPVLKERPWYDPTFTHAGGGDQFFQDKWFQTNKIRPSFKVLHLGPRDHNWFGRATARLDGETPEQADARLRSMRELGLARGWRGRQHIKPLNERVEP